MKTSNIHSTNSYFEYLVLLKKKKFTVYQNICL